MTLMDVMKNTTKDLPPGWRAGGGLAERLTGLYLENRVRLQAFLGKRLGAWSSHEAEDLTHETFMRFWAAYGDGATVENPLAMLYRIAVNIVRDEARSRSYRSQQMEGITGDLFAPLPEPGPEATVSSMQTARQLRQAIDGLPPRCREVFLMHKFGGMSHAGIADLLNISSAAVEKHIMRANARLRAEINTITSLDRPVLKADIRP